MIRRTPLLTTSTLLLACCIAQAIGQEAGTDAKGAATADIDQQISLYPHGNRDWWLRDYPMPAAHRSASVARFGYWATSVDGNKSIIGLYHDLEPSPFWDVDGLTSDGFSTFDYSISQLSEDTFDGDLYYYRPGLSARLDFDHYLHRLEQTPMGGFRAVGEDFEREGNRVFQPGESFPVVTDRLLLDDDLAVRVEEIDARFKGQLTKNIRWHFNFYNLRRHGERQVTSTQHCFDATMAGQAGAVNVCHTTNESQRIDWNTAQFSPGVEGQWGPVTINYTREMRVFSTDDENTSRQFNHFGLFQQDPPAGVRDQELSYGLVPENYTYFDKIKLRTDLTDTTSFYAFGYTGNTENKFRGTEFDYWGYDLRLISRISRGLTVTPYFKENSQKGGTPDEALPNQGEPANTVIGGFGPNDLRSKVDYERTQAGIKGSFKPYEYLCYGPLSGVVVTSGYEYSQIERDDVDYLVNNVRFTLPDTQENSMFFNVSKRWNPHWSTFTRYTLRVIDDPLIGLRTFDNSFGNTNPALASTEHFSNTSLPEHVNLVEIGGTWLPTDNFMVTAQAGLENRDHSSEHANFDEDLYPMSLTAWYAPSCKWTLSAGAGYYTNFIDQDITIGVQPENNVFRAWTDTWGYTARTQVYNIGARYAWTNRLSLHGNIDWLRGTNIFNTAPLAEGVGGPAVDPADVEFAEEFANIIVEQTRFGLGADYIVNDRITMFTKYIFLDFQDIDDGFDSGDAHLLLGGISAVF